MNIDISNAHCGPRIFCSRAKTHFFKVSLHGWEKKHGLLWPTFSCDHTSTFPVPMSLTRATTEAASNYLLVVWSLPFDMLCKGLFFVDIFYQYQLCSKYSVNIKFGTKLIVALCDVFWKIARIGRFYFEKCHTVTYNLFKWRHWFLRNFLNGTPHFFHLFLIDLPTT
jgi:hypothetical protein